MRILVFKQGHSGGAGEDARDLFVPTISCWCPSFSERALSQYIPQTSSQCIHIYAVYVWKDPLLLGSSTLAKDVPKVDVYLRTAIRLELDSRATAVSGDSRFILVGCDDGTVAALSWSGKVGR